MKRILNALAALTLAAAMAAQSQQDPEQVLKDALLHKTLYLQGYSAEKEVHFVWTGTSLEIPDAAVHTLGAIKIKNVRVRPDQVEIDGDRATLVKKPDEKLSLSEATTPVKLFVELRGAGSSTLAGLPGALFFHDEQQAILNLPDAVSSTLPALAMASFAPQKNPPAANSVKPCDCSQNDEHGCGHHYNSPGFEPPFLIAKPGTPVLPSGARRAGKDAFFISVAYTVTADGHATDLWLAAPAGFGLDEQFLAIMARGKFHPPTCHGKPVTATGGLSTIEVAPN